MSGLLGIYGKNTEEISQIMYFGLYALQHRGQVSTGMAINNNGFIDYYKDLGLVSDVYKKDTIKDLRGNIAIGQVRSAFSRGKNDKRNIEPLVIGYKNGAMAIAHDGKIAGSLNLKERLEREGSIFQTDLDSELIANLMARSDKEDLVESLTTVLEDIEGSYSLLVMNRDKLIAARDSYGIKPLSLGRLGENYIVASESCAFDTLGAEFIRDIEAGEILIIDEKGMTSLYKEKRPRQVSSFEYIYFARPDSRIDGKSIYSARLDMGKTLSRESPVAGDIVIGAPDSGIIAAVGYAQEAKIPYTVGLIKNRYVGRTFIEPRKELRKEGVGLKLNALRENVEGKRVILVDDSIVRGSTMKRTIGILRDAGAKEVHIRISSPPVTYSCYLAMDMPDEENLIAANKTIGEMEEEFKADSLRFLSLDGLYKSLGSEDYYVGCFTGNYPIGKDGQRCL